MLSKKYVDRNAALLPYFSKSNLFSLIKEKTHTLKITTKKKSKTKTKEKNMVTPEVIILVLLVILESFFVFLFFKCIAFLFSNGRTVEG